METSVPPQDPPKELLSEQATESPIQAGLPLPVILGPTEAFATTKPVEPELVDARPTSKQLGRSTLIRAGAEVIGFGVDAALIGAGGAGVNVLRGVVTREITATTPEIAILDRFLSRGHEHSKIPLSRARKIGNVALGVTTAIVAQKIGHGAAQHIYSSLNHGVGEFAVPLSSKVGAMTGLNAARRTWGARHAS
jgi:hypothetical protein